MSSFLRCNAREEDIFVVENERHEGSHPRHSEEASLVGIPAEEFQSSTAVKGTK
jgi:hypothetical protein